jgi:hypothetical protein
MLRRNGKGAPLPEPPSETSSSSAESSTQQVGQREVSPPVSQLSSTSEYLEGSQCIQNELRLLDKKQKIRDYNAYIRERKECLRNLQDTDPDEDVNEAVQINIDEEA